MSCLLFDGSCLLFNGSNGKVDEMLYVELFKKMNDEMKEALLCGCVLEYLIGPKWQTYNDLMDVMKVTDIRIRVQAAPVVKDEAVVKEVASKKRKGMWG